MEIRICTHFNSYLSRFPKGALAQEAAFGRIRALRSVGDTAKEKVALEDFLEKYPHAVQSALVRSRLNALNIP